MVDERFVVIDPEVCEVLGIPCIIMLSDYKYWNDHYDTLKEWCNNYNSKVVGMTVELPNPQTLTAFTLRWT